MNELTELYYNSSHIMLYVLNKANKPLDFHKLFKIMYFADQKHLSKYGRKITEDYYVKMPNGPVPSASYDILNMIKKNRNSESSLHNYFKIIGRYEVEALCTYDEDELSETDMWCLDESISENINLSFTQLTDKSHDRAWESAQFSLNEYLIARAGGASQDMINYMKHMENLKNSTTFSK
ncbi:Panacea domain-containing protein [Chryseobacterium sp. HR92]|uniref:Panacea domain-containing protein n=1 Tax=Chryseobacterium sp. HR92 TaxID=3094839 RepID=UPI00388E0586|nr:Panacea domain-containing protein [Chryseobacterium sp. HR92]